MMLRTKALSVSLTLGAPHAAAAVNSIAHVADQTIVSQFDVCLTVCLFVCMHVSWVL
jgi:hypothetical protein